MNTYVSSEPYEYLDTFTAGRWACWETYTDPSTLGTTARYFTVIW